MSDDDNRDPTEQEMNSATFWVVSQHYQRPDITVKLLGELADTGRLPLLWHIAKMLDVPLPELVEQLRQSR